MRKIEFLQKRLKIFLNYFLGPVLFVWLSYSIYNHISNQENWEQSWQAIKGSFYGPEAWRIIVVVILMLLNWGLEAAKWQVLVEHIQRLSFWRSFKAVLSGVSFALNTPNRVGEYFGRVLYINEGNRLRAISLTLVGSISQMIITFLFGFFGLLVLRHELLASTLNTTNGLSSFWFDAVIYGAFVISAGLLLLYYKLSWIIKLMEKIPFVERYSYFIQKLEDFEWRELTKVLIYSLCRYCVFIFQYALLLNVFDVDIDFMHVWWLTTVMFFVMAIVPTIALAELGLRGKVSILLFGLFSNNTLGIVLTATGIWLINLVVPALAGSLLILGIKLFRKKSEKASTDFTAVPDNDKAERRG
ncbi:lysylphosphatidylglycerol synthase transmembrane domain-containing protein [Segetibacter sp. 3557_3]|uniref:lysylphosphatidylglycerol synthase transmembrane domain-containing protein n=1 Tax=Segetibacter sp. 3557_3 TaxID=2547429 RepID=UPI0014043034|nr:lysylphosphatidylglycerol synthase transmembrane domain-containing protein [Segetibacter sp. 3557_3]